MEHIFEIELKFPPAESGDGSRAVGTVLPLGAAAVYAVMFVLVVRLFRSAVKKRRPKVLEELNREPDAVPSKRPEINQIISKLFKNTS